MVKGATRRILFAVVVAEYPSTSKRKSALLADSPEPKPEVMDGPKRPEDVTQPALVA